MNQCVMRSLKKRDLSFWRGRKVLITGHTGFKGSWLCKILEFADADITGFALAPHTHPGLFSICKPKMHSVISDIRDYDALLLTFKTCQPEIVIHMAAQPLVLDSYRDPRYTYDVNVMGTVNVMECVKLFGNVKSLLNVTTDKVYLNNESSKGYREDDQLNGSDPYSNSKSCSELVTSSYYNSFFRQMGVSVSTVRSGNVIGGGDFSVNRLIPDCVRALEHGKTILIRNPNSVRPYQHILDTLFAYLLIVQSQYESQTLSGAYNIGPDEGDCAMNHEIVNCFCESWGNGASWKYSPVDNPHESNMLTLDCSKINCLLGWKPSWHIKQAVHETALWYKAYSCENEANNIMVRQIKEFMVLK